MQQATWSRVVGLPVVLAVVATFMFFATSPPSHVAGLTRRDVVEIGMCEWSLAWRDILPSLSPKDLRAAPRKFWFTFAHRGKPSQPNQKGWVWGALLIPSKGPNQWVTYGGHKQNGRWVLRRLPVSQG